MKQIILQTLKNLMLKHLPIQTLTHYYMSSFQAEKRIVASIITLNRLFSKSPLPKL
jgi:hypothetical protein